MATFAVLQALPITWLMLAVIIGLVLLVRMLSAREILTLLGVVFSVIVALVVYMNLSYQEPPAGEAKVHQVELTQLSTHASSSDEGQTQPPVVPSKEVSISEMWERLTRPRIELESTTAEAGAEAETQEEAASEARPDWVDHPPKRVGNVYREVLSSERYHTVDECYQSLEPELSSAVVRRVGQLTSNSEPPTIADLGIGIDEVLRDVCQDVWVETTEASFGEMKRVHVLLWFDAAVDDRLEQAYQDYYRESRLVGVGSIAGAILGSLTVLYGLLLADTATRGYYTKRLFFGVPAAIIALVLLFVA